MQCHELVSAVIFQDLVEIATQHSGPSNLFLETTTEKKGKQAIETHIDRAEM